MRDKDCTTLLPEESHEPPVDEKYMEQEVLDWIENDHKEKDNTEFMSEQEFCSLENNTLKTARSFQHKFSNKDDPINWTILAAAEDITDCTFFNKIIQKYDEDGAHLDPDLLEAIDIKN
jgi:hypothetical protein